MKRFLASLKSLFFAGLAILIPIIVTIWILKTIVVWSDGFVLSFLPYKFQPKALLGHNIPGLGIIVTLIIVMLAGGFTKLYVGRFIVNLGDKIISKIPLGRSIYGALKQFINALSTSGKGNLKRVVAVEYPRKGCYVIGFPTSKAIEKISSQSDDVWINVFVPTTPNPTSGFLIMVPEKEVIQLHMSVDEAFKLLVSGGFVQTNE